MRKFKLLGICLSLFDGEGGGAATTAAETSTTGETKGGPVYTRRGKSGEFQNVVFGKQETAGAETTTNSVEQSSDAGETKQAEVTVTSNTLDDKRKAYRELMEGEYKDLYTEDTQRIINDRFKQVKGLEQQVAQNQPLIDMLMQRYKIADGDVAKLTAAVESDNAYWSEAAEEAGMSVEQYKQLQKLQRENKALLDEQKRRNGQLQADAALRRWTQEGEAAKKVYPSFDLNTEAQNPQFRAMLNAGVPVQHAYEVVHMEDIKAGIAAMQAKATEKQVVDGIRAKGNRPQEAGTSSQSAFTVKDDVSKLSKKDRAEVARRAAMGEKIVF